MAAASIKGGTSTLHSPRELRGKVDVLLANAPYVPTGSIAMMPQEARLHEPRVALDGGADGLDVQRRLALGAAQWLAPGGSIVMETSEQQAPRTVRLLNEAGVARGGGLGRRIGCNGGARCAKVTPPQTISF